MYYFSKEEGYVLCEDDLEYEERRDSVHTCCTVRCIARSHHHHHHHYHHHHFHQYYNTLFKYHHHHHHHHIDGTYRKLEEKAQLKEDALKQAGKMVEEGK